MFYKGLQISNEYLFKIYLRNRLGFFWVFKLVEQISFDARHDNFMKLFNFYVSFFVVEYGLFEGRQFLSLQHLVWLQNEV